MDSLNRFGTLFLLIAAVGCVRFDPRPIQPEQSLSSFDARSMDDEGLVEYLASNGVPERAGGDAWDLERLTLAAFYFNPAMDLARARVQAAEAGRLSARLRSDPSVSLAPGYDTTTPPPWIWTVDLAIPATTASKRGYRIAEAEYLSDAARWDLAGAAWTVRSRLRSALVEYYSATESLRIQRELDRLESEVLRRTEERVSAGEEAASLLAKVGTEVQNRHLSLAEAEREAAGARAELASAIGLPVSALEGLPIRYDDLDTVPSDLTREAIRTAAALNRTDVRSALAVYAASQSALQLEIAKQYPDVEIGPGYELDQTDNKWTLGLSFTLPLVNRNRGAIAEARAHREEAAAEFGMVQTEALNEVDRVLDSFEAARREGVAADSLAVLLERNRRSAQERADAGDLGPMDIVKAQILYGEGSLARISAIRNVQQALGELESTVQRPLTGSSFTWPDTAPPPSKDRDEP